MKNGKTTQLSSQLKIGWMNKGGSKSCQKKKKIR